MGQASATDGAHGPVAGPWVYVGLFFVTLATLMEEILLTRIFSVTMWYHYAFFAVSIAMFGMTVGALLVYLRPGTFTPERAPAQLALFALLFAVTIVVGFLTQLAIPFVPEWTLVALYSVALTCLLIAAPFICGGVCVCLALTRFPRQVSRLYAVDLAGAAVGCVLIIGVLRITDGPTAVIVTAVLAAVGAWCFAAQAEARRYRRAAFAVTALLGLFCVGNTVLVHRQAQLLRLVWVKQAREYPGRFEKWNSFSRLRVEGSFTSPQPVFGWGLSPSMPRTRHQQLMLNIDACAATWLTYFTGDARAVDYLKYDIINAAHSLRRNAKVLVIGVGGGRDILSALVFNQQSVRGVELNGDILHAVNHTFGDFTGHLDRNPKVSFVNDEARSYVARQKDRFDIIQVSLIDTWAATAAGAYVLAENSLYTTEAWQTLLSRLTPRGVLTFSRWYNKETPGEIYRMVSLATNALLAQGIANPREHIMLLRIMRPVGGADEPDGVGTILVSPSPFTPEDVAAVKALARTREFEVVLTPTMARDFTLNMLANSRSREDLDKYTSHYPIDISPTTDDRPYFFLMLRARDLLHPAPVIRGAMRLNILAVSVLGILLVVVAVLTLLCVIVPLLRAGNRRTLRGAGPLLLFFCCIGLGFMFVEISQMQRLIVFLGHPTYGLSVVLFSLLLSSGLGSYTTQGDGRLGPARSAGLRLAVLLAALIGFGLLTPHVITSFQAASTPVRILVSVGMLFPLGLLMGMPFPLGMRLAAGRAGALTPWLWGVNGATSVCASVLAVVVGMAAGISASFWTGFGCYLVALLAFSAAGRRAREEAVPEEAVAASAQAG